MNSAGRNPIVPAGREPAESAAPLAGKPRSPFGFEAELQDDGNGEKDCRLQIPADRISGACPQ